jgi:hypothetical protein
VLLRNGTDFMVSERVANHGFWNQKFFEKINIFMAQPIVMKDCIAKN